ncbi:MAG TPA: ADP-ribosylglycohydrolase family protein [Bacillota bacterium]|nr:ADP-ribosylglycohydrolase family protein [Bacillota bacterium]
MIKAWEQARIITDQAVPRLLTEEEQTWEAMMDVGEAEDAHLRLLWSSHVPGSYAPESIMLAAIQAKENMGFAVPDGMPLWEAGIAALEAGDMVELNRLSARLWHAVNHADADTSHPSRRYKQYGSWDEYCADVSFCPGLGADPESLEDKMYAGWMGRIAGGALGTMIEGYTTGMIRKTFGDVRGYLRKPSTYNDDITYELAFLFEFEDKGRSITSADVAESWIAYVPSGWSAEEIALRNIRGGIMPPESGRFNNPFGEWIGAQMRGAICGQLAPGDPMEAARLAWIDGEVSHVNNGIIGEVFNAMLVSLAFVESDMRTIVKKCIGMLPPESEYYAIVKFALLACEEETSWEKAWARCEQRVARYNWIHAYPNAAAEVVALWFGRGDFDETAFIISMAGQDVDCNAAQILAAVGTVVDIEGIDPKWTQPIGDELVTYLRRYRTISIRELAARTARAALR